MEELCVEESSGQSRATAVRTDARVLFLHSVNKPNIQVARHPTHLRRYRNKNKIRHALVSLLVMSGLFIFVFCFLLSCLSTHSPSTPCRHQPEVISAWFRSASAKWIERRKSRWLNVRPKCNETHVTLNERMEVGCLDWVLILGILFDLENKINHTWSLWLLVDEIACYGVTRCKLLHVDKFLKTTL